jgi:predicted anti-sigma-YlaC factor YlaD
MSPCWHMKALLAQRADQRLSGLLRHYFDLHLSQCAQCRAALESLLALRERLTALRNAPSEPLSPERQQRIDTAVTELLKRHKDPP